MYFGMPQLGAAIGGFIGGALDPTKIEGPHIGDGRQQSSTEGQSIAWILGTAGWLQGDVVQVSAVREIKKEDDGKGGPVTITYEAHQDFCLMPSESSETRNSVIVGVLMVRQNGMIVYDMRPDANFGAENAKFLQHHRFYYGAEDQLPDPTMESITGVGNTPAYRGVFTMVGFDVNLTPFGNAIPTYEFVLVGEGEVVEETITSLAGPVYGRFANQPFPLVDPDALYTFAGQRIVGPGVTHNFSAPTLQQVLDHFSAIGYGGYPKPVNTYLGYSASTGPEPGSLKISTVEPQLDVTNNTHVLLIYSETEAEDWFDIISSGACPVLPYASPGQDPWYGFYDGTLGRIHIGGATPDPAFGGGTSCTSEFPPESGYFPFVQTINPLYISVGASSEPPSEAPVGNPCELGVPTKVPDAPGYVQDCEGNVFPEPTYEEVTGTFKALRSEQTGGDGGRTVFLRKTVGPILLNTDPDNTEAFWEAAYDSALVAGTVPAGLVYPTDYPQTLTTAFESSYTTTHLLTDAISVATAIERIAARSDLLPTDIDTTAIVDTVDGYAIQANYNGADSIKPLLAFSAAFGSEYDGKIYFLPYGGPIEITIDPLDYIEGSNETDIDTREQAKEFPKKVSVSTIDITQNYTVRPQYDYRNSPDIRAIGEESVQVPVCTTPDRTSKIANITMKVSWARQQGSRKFQVPWVGYNTYLQLAAGLPFGLEGKRWICNRVTIDDGVLTIEAGYDRQSAYTSIATGVPAQPPTPPRSTIGGVTIMAVMNSPALRDQDDRLGLYFAVSGILSGWPGCVLQMSVDGGATWTNEIPSMTQASTMGNLVAYLEDASFAGDDVTNTLSVNVHGGELNSITETQYLNEGNPSAIVLPDGTVEIIQFRDALEIDEGRYDLTFLARGRLGSETNAHNSGEQFVFLDSVYFLELPVGLIGRTLLFRAVTFDTTPESAATYSIVFSPAWSQTELAPELLTSSRDGDTLTLSVVPVHRFGTPITPVQSSNLLAYRFQATDGVNVADVTVGTPTTPISVAGWSSPITVTVNAVNRFTGDGFPLIEEIAI